MNVALTDKNNDVDTKSFLRCMAREYAKCFELYEEENVFSVGYLNTVFARICKKFYCKNIDVEIIFKFGDDVNCDCNFVPTSSINYSNSFEPNKIPDCNNAIPNKAPGIYELSQKFKNIKPNTNNAVNQICPCDAGKIQPSCTEFQNAVITRTQPNCSPCSPKLDIRTVCPPNPDKCVPRYNDCNRLPPPRTNCTDIDFIRTLRSECYMANNPSIRSSDNRNLARSRMLARSLWTKPAPICPIVKTKVPRKDSLKSKNIANFNPDKNNLKISPYPAIKNQRPVPLDRQISGTRLGTPVDEQHSQWNIDSLLPGKTTPISSQNSSPKQSLGSPISVSSRSLKMSQRGLRSPSHDPDPDPNSRRSSKSRKSSCSNSGGRRSRKHSSGRRSSRHSGRSSRRNSGKSSGRSSGSRSKSKSRHSSKHKYVSKRSSNMKTEYDVDPSMFQTDISKERNAPPSEATCYCEGGPTVCEDTCGPATPTNECDGCSFGVDLQRVSSGRSSNKSYKCPSTNMTPGHCLDCDYKRVGKRKFCVCSGNKRNMSVYASETDIDKEFPEMVAEICTCDEDANLNDLRVVQLRSDVEETSISCGKTFVNIDTFIKIEKGQGEGVNEPYSKVLLDSSRCLPLPKLKEIVFTAGGQSVVVTSHLFLDKNLSGHIK